jgi:hypothetical protein
MKANESYTDQIGGGSDGWNNLEQLAATCNCRALSLAGHILPKKAKFIFSSLKGTD